LGHFCGHWVIFSQKHLVTLTFDERLTFVERVPTKRPGFSYAHVNSVAKLGEISQQEKKILPQLIVKVQNPCGHIFYYFK
jgi:hypothetical protein